jgi:hypothetical protein
MIKFNIKNLKSCLAILLTTRLQLFGFVILNINMLTLTSTFVISLYEIYYCSVQKNFYIIISSVFYR